MLSSLHARPFCNGCSRCPAVGTRHSCLRYKWDIIRSIIKSVTGIQSSKLKVIVSPGPGVRLCVSDMCLQSAAALG